MFSNSEVADVLEKAADLYESEKIEWCSGRWVGHHLREDGSAMMSACAATSLGMAAGLGHDLVGLIDTLVFKDGATDEGVRRYVENTLDEGFVSRTSVLNYTPRDVRLYAQARGVVEERIIESYGGSTLPNFNDSVRGSKTAVIELFKETAKDLRNA